MRVQISSNGPAKPAEIQKAKLNIARKAGKKHIYGNTYKTRTYWNKFCDWIASSRGMSVIPKALYESKQYTQAAILRKDTAAEKLSLKLGRELTDEEYDNLVWNSNGVQNRTMREDHVRYNTEHYSASNGATKRNQRAHSISRIAHKLHGLCEMFAAPTGMTSILLRNAVTGPTDEKSNKNKLFMTGLLSFVGLGTLYGLSESKGAMKNAAALAASSLGSLAVSVFVAFPAGSAFCGFLGTLVGAASQLTVEKQSMGLGQKEGINKDIRQNLNDLLPHLKSAKDNAQSTKILSKAMQGRHMFGKIKADSVDAIGTPLLLKQALAAIDLSKTDVENLVSLKRAIGEYLQVEKPAENATRWENYKYAKEVTAKESHYVALASLVDHLETRTAPDHVVDMRRGLERDCLKMLHSTVLQCIAVPASYLDKVTGTEWGETLKKWATPEYQKKHAEKMADPTRAAKNSFKGEYMAKHIHQYGRITRGLIILAEGLRIVNMNIILASNANLSRIFNNAALNIQATVGTGPPSRSVCLSTGRFFGGSALAAIFGAGIPAAAGGEGAITKEMPGVGLKYSYLNIGMLMFVVSIPTYIVMGLAQMTARIEGWQGDMPKSKPKGVNTIEF